MAAWGFWAAAVGLGLAVAAILVQALRRARDGAAPAGEADLRVYRDQLAEVERDLARGTLNEAEAARARAEVGRRVLEADRTRGASLDAKGEAGSARAGLVPGLAVVVAVLAAGGLYVVLGVPGYPDLPLQDRLAQSDAMMKSRPSQAEVVAAQPPAPGVTAPDPEFAALMDRLREAVIARPDDQRGLELLARNEAALGNIDAALAATTQLIAAKGAQATAEDHAGLAELMIRQAGGYVSPEAEAALVRALQADSTNGVARYFSGLMFAQGGRYDRTFVLWRNLLDDGPPDAPWIGPIRAQMDDIAMRAGVNFTLADLPGPGAGDVAAAAGMSEADRAAMIEGMVAQLSDRLATEGGTVEEWARLIRALGVLARTDEAATIYAEAQGRFAGQASALSFLKEAALEAGITP